MKDNNIMKTRIALLNLIVLTFSIFSCSKEDVDDQKPVVSNLEIGHEGKFQTGSELHVDFEVTDNEALAYYQISIHSESVHKTAQSWDYDNKFDEINGLKNYTVHNHEIIVPLDAALGEYHVDLRVVDMAGNVNEMELSLELVSEDIGHE